MIVIYPFNNLVYSHHPTAQHCSDTIYGSKVCICIYGVYKRYEIILLVKKCSNPVACIFFFHLSPAISFTFSLKEKVKLLYI